MAKEPDVARVAAAFNAPGLKYRSFGNMPVRSETVRSETGRSETGRSEAVPQDPEAILREIRAAARQARQAEIEAPDAEPEPVESPAAVVAGPPPAPIQEQVPVAEVTEAPSSLPPAEPVGPERSATAVAALVGPEPVVAPSPPPEVLPEAVPLPAEIARAVPPPPPPPPAPPRAAAATPRPMPAPAPPLSPPRVAAVSPPPPAPPRPVRAPTIAAPSPVAPPALDALRPAVPVREPHPEPAIDWVALASAARPAPPPIRPTQIAAFARPAEPAVAASTEFSLLDSIGAMPEPAPPPAPPGGGTLARLRSQIAGSTEQPLPAPACQASPPVLSAPPAGPSAGGGVVPASAVTVSLGEVMRLIAAGSPPTASPIDTLRAALRSSSPF